MYVVWLTQKSKRLCFRIVLNKQHIIIWTAPIAKRFEGQPYKNILNWLGGDIEAMELEYDECNLCRGKK